MDSESWALESEIQLKESRIQVYLGSRENELDHILESIALVEVLAFTLVNI